MTKQRRSPRVRGLSWVLVALTAAITPHVRYLPVWVVLLVLAIAAWRRAADLRGWPLPPQWLRGVVVVGATLAVLATYKTVNGLEAGTTFLVLMAGVKLLETRAARDLTVMVFIAWFLLFAALLRNQNLLQVPWLLASAWITTSALIRVHTRKRGASTRDVLRQSTALLLQAVPLALLLFLLFPRLPGPFWGLDTGSSARTGLDDEMTPGDVSELSASGDPAFRVRFQGAPPRPEQRYWRGPVLHEFDGRSWRRPRAQAFPPQSVEFRGKPIHYQITLEPHARRWLLALDLPSDWPGGEVTQAYDFTLLSARTIASVKAFQLTSYPTYVAGLDLPASMRHKDLGLPDDGTNPRAVALGRELAARHPGDPGAIVRSMLQRFRSEPFEYTMRPPRLAANGIDEFLFDTRKGFCEHYAAAFTVVMRAAGIPARVVTGYQGGEFNPYGGYLLVRQSDAHAWSEVWIDGRGWQRVDPTAAVAPERIQRGLIDAVAADEPVPGRLREASPLWLKVELGWDVVNDFWNERVVRFDAQSQFAMLESFGLDEPDWRALGLAMAASFAVFFVVLSAYLAWAYRRPQRDWPARLHDVVARRLGKRGFVPETAEGPNAFLERAEAACPDIASRLAEIRELYAAQRYGPAPRERDLQRLKHLVNTLET